MQSSDLDKNDNNFVIATAADDGNNCVLALKMMNTQ